MQMVRVSGRIGLISLWTSLITYSVSLILYIISYSLPDWIVYTTVPIKIGIWRLCDIQNIGYDRCADWNSRIYPSNITNQVFLGPPDFVRTSQSLEIVALVFYIIGGFLLVIGLFQRSMGLFFFGSSMSMFITIIFVSSTVGLFAGKGKTSHEGYLSFAWWIGTSALLISVICAISLIVLSFYILPISMEINENKKNIELDGKMYYSPPAYSTNLYLPQQLNTEFIQ